MTKAIENKETIEQVEQEATKPYTFRKLSSEDMFLMFKIIGKIGIKELKNCISGDDVATLMSSVKDGSDKAIAAIGVAVVIDAVDIVLGNVYKCEKEIYQLLSQVSGMPESEIRADALLFTEMLIDFVKKPEFPGFIKVVSKLFK
jgi:hypothetical protein